MSDSKPVAPMMSFNGASHDSNEGSAQPGEGVGLDNLPVDFDFDAAAQEYGPLPDYATLGPGLIGYDYSSGMIQNNDNINDYYEDGYEGTHDVKTPGYFLGNDSADHTPPDLFYQHAAPNRDNFHSYPTQDEPSPSATHTFDIETPYVPPAPLPSSDGDIPDLDINDSTANQAEDFVAPESPFSTNFAASEPPSSASKAGPTKKTPKKTPAARGKGKGKGKTKSKAVVAEEYEEDDDEDEEEPSSSTMTRGKRGRAASKAKTATSSKKPKTAKSAKKPAKKAAEKILDTMGHQRVRQAAKNGISQTKPIPNTLDECDEADKALITMRDNGAAWPEIKTRYAELSGVTHGDSTLPNRYERLKTAFIAMRDEDNLLLFEAKKEVEADFDKKKWALISDAIEEKGGNRYDPTDLKRRFKQLMGKTGFPVNEGLAKLDVDFKDVGEVEGEDITETVEFARTVPDIQWDDEDVQGGADHDHEQYDGQDQMDVDADDADEDSFAW